MTKKSRRVRRKDTQARLSKAQLAQPVAGQAPPEVQDAPEVEPVQQPEALDFGEEYRYVVSDLQTIGILAAMMLGGLIVLSFVL